MTNEDSNVDNVTDRTPMNAVAVGGDALAESGDSTASHRIEKGDGRGDRVSLVDEPERIEVSIPQRLPSPVECAATFSPTFPGTVDDDDGSLSGAYTHLEDESTVVIPDGDAVQGEGFR